MKKINHKSIFNDRLMGEDENLRVEDIENIKKYGGKTKRTKTKTKNKKNKKKQRQNRKKTNMHYPDLSPDDVLAGEKRAKKSNYYVHDTAAWPDLVKMKENRKKLNVQPAAFETEYTEYIDYRSAHETGWSPKGFKDK